MTPQAEGRVGPKERCVEPNLFRKLLCFTRLRSLMNSGILRIREIRARKYMLESSTVYFLDVDYN